MGEEKEDLAPNIQFDDTNNDMKTNLYITRDKCTKYSSIKNIMDCPKGINRNLQYIKTSRVLC